MIENKYIECTVSEQKFDAEEIELKSNSQKWVWLKFSYDSVWSNMEQIFIVFGNSSTEISALEVENGKVRIPDKILKMYRFEAGLIGINKQVVITTNKVVFRQNEGTATPTAPTGENDRYWYVTLLEKIQSENVLALKKLYETKELTLEEFNKKMKEADGFYDSKTAESVREMQNVRDNFIHETEQVENVRQENESQRQENENVRQENESQRQENENVRQENEAQRQEDENVRQKNEAQRQKTIEQAQEATKQAQEALQNQEQLKQTLEAVTQMNNTVTEHYNIVLDKSRLTDEAANNAKNSATIASNNATEAKNSAVQADAAKKNAATYAEQAADSETKANDYMNNAFATTPEGFSDLVVAFNNLGLIVNDEGEICISYDE